MAPPITVHIGNDAMGHQLPADIPSDQRDTDVVRLIGADSSPSLSKAGIMDLILAKLQVFYYYLNYILICTINLCVFFLKEFG